jgi:CubicO group peptidase (beta-lactamase class C family)
VNKRIKRILKYAIRGILICLVIAIAILLWKALPVLNGYNAKTICSAVFVNGRTPASVLNEELGAFPFNMPDCTINEKDSSVTAAIWGLARKKAIFRKGVGATLINEISEEELRKQAFQLPEPPAINQDTIDWPQGNRINTNLPDGLNQAQLNAALDSAFKEPGPRPERRTRAVLVVYNGQIIAERYAAGYSANSKQFGWSMTKSITNAMLGILVKQGKLDVNSPAPVSGWKEDDRKKITIKNLMQLNSGLRWSESTMLPSDLTNMLFNKKSLGVFAEQPPLAYKPGSQFYYSSGSVNILSEIIRNTIPDSSYYRFPYEQLFYKIGMLNTILEPDAGGTFVGSSYAHATSRDWARFGLLYLNDGIWNGERILPEGWVQFTATASPVPTRSHHGEYGALWWVNAAVGSNPLNRVYPNVPADCFSCQGFAGQYVWVIPSKKLVVVRLGHESGNKLNGDQFLSAVIKALPNQ